MPVKVNVPHGRNAEQDHTFRNRGKVKLSEKKVKQVKFLLYPKEQLINFEDGVSPSAS
jgi:hypothetical protein